jgi:pimeloyl-ACP methyl ester carboxylesterase
MPTMGIMHSTLRDATTPYPRRHSPLFSTTKNQNSSAFPPQHHISPHYPVKIISAMNFPQLSFLLVITLLSCGGEGAQEAKESTNLNTFVQGEGSPTVVFESGLGTPLNNWAQIQAGISDQYQTISYDRRGIGDSPDSDDPRTLEHYVKDLHQVLAENEIDGPIVLVGHSLGGHIVRKYQATFPSKVVGLFLIDPTHEDLYDAVFEEMSEAAADSMKTAWDESFKKGAVGVFKEWEEAYSNDEKMRDCPLPGDIPITILASYQESTFLTETNRRLKKKCFSDWEKGKVTILNTSNSGHYIHLGEPEWVIAELEMFLGGVE